MGNDNLVLIDRPIPRRPFSTQGCRFAVQLPDVCGGASEPPLAETSTCILSGRPLPFANAVPAF